jgi:hypothetical protein
MKHQQSYFSSPGRSSSFYGSMSRNVLQTRLDARPNHLHIDFIVSGRLDGTGRLLDTFIDDCRSRLCEALVIRRSNRAPLDRIPNRLNGRRLGFGGLAFL